MDELMDRVLYELDKGYHCSQVMMRLSMDLRGIDDPFTIRALGALGGGMFAQRACGTLTGGACLLASYFSREEGEPEPAAYQNLVRKLAIWFEETYGSIECRNLVGSDLGRASTLCPRMMAETFAKCLELLEEEGVDPYE